MDERDPFNPFASDIPQPQRVMVGGSEIREGDRVILHPLGRADILDIALEGKSATVVSIEQDFENRLYVAVTVDDDPGKDFGHTGKPGHRFFFGVEEIEPAPRASAEARS